MHRLTTLALCLALASHAFAQDAAPAAATPPAATTPAAPTPPSAAERAAPEAPAAAPEVTAPAPTAQPASSRAACLIGASAGIPEADALTATGLVCEALAQASANIDATPSPVGSAQGTSAYRVELHPLGKLLLLKVSFESPIGTSVDSRTMQLGKIEEMPVAATRIAQSLITGKPLEDTAKMNTLVGAETRPYAKEYGELSVGIGVLGFGAFNTNVAAGYGLYGQLFYEVLRYGVGADLRIAGSGMDSGDASMTSVSLSGRYFFSDGDISPFIGGGFGVLWFSHQGDSLAAPPSYAGSTYYYGDYRQFEGSGAAAHTDVGIEMMRMHDVRFDALLRVDLPLFLVHETSSSSDKYVVPVSIMGSFSFQ